MGQAEIVAAKTSQPRFCTDFIAKPCRFRQIRVTLEDAQILIRYWPNFGKSKVCGPPFCSPNCINDITHLMVLLKNQGPILKQISIGPELI